MTNQFPSYEAICAAVKDRVQWGISALKDLIAIDSVSPAETACQITLERLLKSEGLDTKLIELDDQLRNIEGFHDDGLPFDKRPNLVAFFGGKQPESKSLILNAHIDTVEWQSQLNAWDDHPLSASIKDGRIYGRGAVDDKGQVIMAAMAILALADMSYFPSGLVILQSVIGEEPSGNGTLALCSQGFLADAAVNLEPTENCIHYGHKGVIAWRFTIEGEAKHGSVVNSSANTIAEMGRLAGMLNTQLEGWYAIEDVAYGQPKTNIGTIAGGTDVFTTPTTCQMEFAVRYAPGTYQKVSAITESTIASFLKTLEPKQLRCHHQVFLHHDASAVDPQSEFVATMRNCVQSVEGNSTLFTFPGGADARHFNNRYKIPALLFGSGSLAQAHTVNEFLPLDQWERGARILALLIRDWCT